MIESASEFTTILPFPFVDISGDYGIADGEN
jgi:hypothetical protein